MTWLLSALFSLHKAATALWSLARRYPLIAALIAALCLSAWMWHGKGKALAERDAARDRVAQLEAAVAGSEAKAKQARADAEKLSKDIAHAADEYANDLDAISRRALAGRMRPSPRCSGDTAAAAVPDDPARDPEADTGGAVAFTADEADALRRHEVRSTACEAWARGLIGAGLAVE